MGKIGRTTTAGIFDSRILLLDTGVNVGSFDDDDGVFLLSELVDVMISIGTTTTSAVLLPEEGS